MKTISALFAVAALLAMSAVASAAERAKAEVECEMADEELVYDCMIMLMNKSSGEPIPGAEIVVKPDMPSMPMAHNIAPIRAKAMGMPGSYHARLELEMQGEWALTIDVSGPLRDRLVKKLQFGAMNAMKPDDGNMAHDHGMKHDGTKPKGE